MATLHSQFHSVAVIFACFTCLLWLMSFFKFDFRKVVEPNYYEDVVIVNDREVDAFVKRVRNTGVVVSILLVLKTSLSLLYWAKFMLARFLFIALRMNITKLKQRISRMKMAQNNLQFLQGSAYVLVRGDGQTYITMKQIKSG